MKTRSDMCVYIERTCTDMNILHMHTRFAHVLFACVYIYTYIYIYKCICIYIHIYHI